MNRIHLIPVLILSTLMLASCLSDQEEPGGGGGFSTELTGYTETVDGKTRSYWVYHPEEPPRGPMPLVMMFHGANGSGLGMSNALQFNQIAEEEGFIVAYPNALVGNWAEGCGCNNADRLKVKDMEFVERIIGRMSRNFAVDEERVFGVGFSQGGLFAGRLGCEASDLFRGLVIVAANMSVPLSRSCNPEQPVAVRIIQGVADEVLPYGGTDNGALSLLSAKDAAALWARLDGIADHKSLTYRPDKERLQVEVTRYRDPDGNPRRFVELLSVTMTGHTWIRNPWANSEEEIRELVMNH